MFPGFAKLSGKQTGKFPGFKLFQKVVMMSQNPVSDRISQPWANDVTSLLNYRCFRIFYEPQILWDDFLFQEKSCDHELLNLNSSSCVLSAI